MLLLQVVCFQLLLILCTRCCSNNIHPIVSESNEIDDEYDDVATADAIVPKVVVEMFRVQIFLQVR